MSEYSHAGVSIYQAAPRDIIHSIFKFLSLSDMLPAAQSCHTWWSAALREKSRSVKLDSLFLSRWRELSKSPLRFHVGELYARRSPVYLSRVMKLLHVLPKCHQVNVTLVHAQIVSLTKPLPPFPSTITSFILEFTQNPDMTVLSLLYAAIAPCLQSLSYMNLYSPNVRFGEAELQFLIQIIARCQSLKTLRIMSNYKFYVADTVKVDMSLLSELKNLTQLEIMGQYCFANEVTWKAIGQLPLKKLELKIPDFDRFADVMVSSRDMLSGMIKFDVNQYISLSQMQLLVGAMPHLRHWTVYSSHRHVLALLHRFPLKTICLARFDIAHIDDLVHGISLCTSLTYIDAERFQLTLQDAQFRRMVQHLSNLTTLECSGCMFALDGLSCLSACPSIERLIIEDGSLASCELLHIRGLPCLRRLGLFDCCNLDSLGCELFRPPSMLFPQLTHFSYSGRNPIAQQMVSEVDYNWGFEEDLEE